MQKKVKGGESSIYKQYLPHFLDFLESHARYDIDSDGKLWCSKDDWNNYLFPFIKEDHANSIGYRHCKATANTTTQILQLLDAGKKYICHRLYNMRFVKNLERRKIGRNVMYFRLLGDGEIPTPPESTSLHLMRKVFTERGKKQGASFTISPDDALDALMEKLNKQLFPGESQQIDEYRRVIGILMRQKAVKNNEGMLVYTLK